MKRETFRFGTPRQETGSKHVPPGTLLEAINVRQVKGGVYGKRSGFARTAKTYSGGTLSGTPVCVTSAEYGASLMRDSGGQLWASSSAGTEWLYRGKRKTLWPSHNTVLANRYTNPMPFSCVVGTKVWVFAIGTSVYHLTIIDSTTGTVETPQVTVTATNILNASAAYDGTNVWVFWVDGGSNGTIRCHKFVVATPTVAPTATTYYTFPANASDPVIGGSYDLRTAALQHVKASYLSAAGKVYVAACGGRYSAPNFYRGAVTTYLNPANGTAASSGILLAYVGTSGGGHTVGALCIADGQDGSGAYLYVCMNGFVRSTAFTSAYTTQWKIDANNLAATAQALSAGVSDGIWSCAGFVDGTNQYYLLTQQSSATYLGATQVSYFTVGFHVTGTTVTESSFTVFPFKDWIASGFVKQGSDWYCLTGFDDYATASVSFGSEALTLQRMFHVVKVAIGASASATVVTLEAQVDPGDGPAIYHKSSAAMSIPAAAPIPACCPALNAIGTSFYTAVGVKASVTGFVDVALMTIETSHAVGKDCSFSGRGVTPGNIPMVWSLADNAHEIAPMTFPPTLAITATGSDYNIAAIVYVIYDSDGTAWRSAPKVVASTYGETSTFRFYAPMHGLAGTSTFVEVYIGNAGVAKLQTVLTPSLAAEMTYTVPALAAMLEGETLYTTGGAMASTWPVACQCAGSWRNRVFLANDEDVWFSKEIETGFGPLFNEIMRTYLSDADSNIVGMCPVDSNYFALVSANSVGVISGPGPDGIGHGNYTVQMLSSKEGMTIGYPLVKGPSGAYFQDSNTGRLHCITPSLTVVECAPGSYDYSAYVITDITWNDRQNQMVFWARASQAAIVIDYQHPAELVPFGISTLWTFDATIGAYGASVDTSSMFFIDSGGHVYRQSAAQWVDSLVSSSATYKMKIASAELQPAGMQGEFCLSEVQALVSIFSASGFTLKTYPGFASRTGSDARISTKTVSFATPTNAGDPHKVMHRPSYCGRIEGFGFSIEEASISGRSFEFEGFAIEYVPTGRLGYPASGKVI